MSFRIPRKSTASSIPVGTGSIRALLDRTGRLPPVTLRITPIDGGRGAVFLDKFLTYEFSSNVLVPVDSFSFTYIAPDDPNPVVSSIKEGDVVTLYANNVAISTGIIDQLDIEVDAQYGERVTISGRDVLGQFADQEAVNKSNGAPVIQNATLESVLRFLIQDTRIPSFRFQNLKSSDINTKRFFAVQPGETKLDALQRHLDSLNMIMWTDGTGQLVIGKPNMNQPNRGELVCSKSQRGRTNVFQMRAAYSSTTIPNFIVPMYSGQEIAGVRAQLARKVLNNADGPKRLRKAGHVVLRTMVTSFPGAESAQDTAGLNVLVEANRLESGNLAKLHALRELAKMNHKELIVQCVVPGHYNEVADPFHVDQLYKVTFDRGAVNGIDMYLFSVKYELSEDTGQRTTLQLCKLGTICAQNTVKTS